MHQLGFPINLEIIIPKDDSVRTLYEVTEGLDYSELYKTYSTEGRNPTILPETLFRILLMDIWKVYILEESLKKLVKEILTFVGFCKGKRNRVIIQLQDLEVKS